MHRIREMTPEELIGRLNHVEKKNAPAKLFVGGDIGVLRRRPRVSIVGSRKASAADISQARELAEELSRRGAVVVSGLAEGIDTAAHQGCIATGGRTIAVLGTSLVECFPVKNRELQQFIMKAHLAVSQFPSGVPARPGNFPMRNRTMALLSDATVIVEAGEKSGSLQCAWETLRLGRPLYFLKHALSPALSWPEKLVRYGARALALEDLEPVLSALGKPREPQMTEASV